jgi:hypothetical protein
VNAREYQILLIKLEWIEEVCKDNEEALFRIKNTRAAIQKMRGGQS